MNVKVKQNEINIYDDVKLVKRKNKDKVSGNFKWWEVDSGKLIIVTGMIYLF
ncbi:MAG: hypothetical protein IPM38_05685 [Ignavibacteria bacterium]|nr:hypothetical protein [Ignavibacteria bacterium]